AEVFGLDTAYNRRRRGINVGGRKPQDLGDGIHNHAHGNALDFHHNDAGMDGLLFHREPEPFMEVNDGNDPPSYVDDAFHKLGRARHFGDAMHPDNFMYDVYFNVVGLIPQLDYTI